MSVVLNNKIKIFTKTWSKNHWITVCLINHCAIIVKYTTRFTLLYSWFNVLSQHVSHGFPRCLVSSWTCHTAASPWVCCQWSCERTAALVSQSSQSGGTAAEVKVSQTFMDNNKEEGSLCIYSGFYLNNFKYSKCFGVFLGFFYVWRFLQCFTELQQAYLALWLG